MYEFSKLEERQILEEAYKCQGNLLAQKGWKLVYSIVEIRFKLYRLPYIDKDVEDYRTKSFISFIENCYYRIRQFDPEKGSLKNWLAILIKHVIVDDLNLKSDVYSFSAYSIRSEMPQGEDEEKNKPVAIENEPIVREIDDLLDKIQKLDTIREYLIQLTPEQQMAISLTYFDNLPTKQIIRIMQITKENYFVILHRAKEKLKKILKKYEPEHFQ
jgi:RNA polymerase sigma factor (sigma-70 family)